MTLSFPGILADIAEVAGEEAAVLIARAAGGTEAYIPKPENLGRAGKWMVDAVGEARARAIADRLGGGHVLIPLGPGGSRAQVWSVIQKALGEGKSNAQAARLAGVHLRTVERHRGGHSGKGSDDPDQGKLF